MSLHRPALRRPFVLTAVLVIASAGLSLAPFAASPAAYALDEDAAVGEDRTRIEDLVRSLTNNRVVARDDKQVSERIGVLLKSKNPYARRKLREMIANTGAPSNVIEYLGKAVLFEQDEDDLVPDVVDRLRVERDSTLARSFDDALMRYADAGLVRQLSMLARDPARAAGFRVTAVRILGKTGHTQALPVLVDLWGDPSPEIRLAASRAFVKVVPFVTSREEAVALLVEMADEGLPLVEVLRRRVRETESALRGATETNYRREYVDLALASLPFVPLPELLLHYLDAPVAELRLAAAERLRTFDWDAEPDPALARIESGRALLRTLRKEEDTGVEEAVLAALLPLARSLTDHVDRDALEALLARARVEGPATKEVRIAAIRLLGALRLRDPLPVAVLQEEFDALGDTAPELRVVILHALSSIAVDLTGWLRERILREPSKPVADAMSLELAKKDDPGAVEVFEQLLAAPHPSEITRHNATTGLGNLWGDRGVASARDALIRYGLNDESATVRQNSILGLGRGTATDEKVLAALEDVVLRPTEDDRVRKPATKAILAFDPEGSLERLMPALADPAIWEVYRDRRIDDLQDAKIDVTTILREADALWASDDAQVHERAVHLLQAVVDAGTGLWDGPEGRGLVHEQLARRLLDSARPEDACEVAEALLSEDLRADDPQFRWRLLLARSLNACGAREPLLRAERQLASMRSTEDLPLQFRTPVLLELGDVLLGLGDPTGAWQALGMIGDDAELTRAQGDRRDELIGEAERQSDAEKRRVLELLGRVHEDDARVELARLGFLAARHLHAALLAETDPARVLQLVDAAGVVTDSPIEVPETPTPEDVTAAGLSAREALAEVIERGWGDTGR